MHKLGLKAGYKAALLLLVAGLLAGCAGQRLHDDGMSLVNQGRYEEGLAKMEEASKADSGNLSFKADFLRTRGQVVNRLLATANSERTLGRLDAARSAYERILRIEPDNSVAQAGLKSLEMDRRHNMLMEEARILLKRGELAKAGAALKPVLLENPRNGEALLLKRQIDEEVGKSQVTEPELMTKFKKPVTMQFRDANVKMVFEAISRASGINILLDRDVRADIKTSIFVKDVSVEDAIELILLQSKLEKKVISDNTLLIYPNTPLKAKEYQDLKIRSFHLVNADPKQMMALIKSMLKTKDIYVHEKTNSLVMRDTPEAIRLAEKLIADQDVADPEVMLEVEVLEISRSHLSELGIKLPTQMNFTPIAGLATAAGATGAAATTVAQLTVNGLRGLNERNIGVSPLPTVTLNAMLQDGSTNLLASPRIRVRNREKAKIMIGERVPMITNSITPVATGSPVVTGTVTYQDVGLKLDVEPEIHLDNEVTIKVGLEVSSLGLAVNNPSGSTVYRVGTRNASTVLRLKDGETQILAGLIQDDERNTTDKIPGLGQLPIAGRLFSSKKDDNAKTEIILSITPHIVGENRQLDAHEVEYWTGTEAALRTSPLMAKELGTVSQNGAAKYPAIPARPVNAASVPAPAVQPPATPAPAPALQAPPKPAAPAPTASAPAPAATTPPPAAAAAKPALSQVFSWQGTSLARVGDKIKLTLNTEAVQNVKDLSLVVNYAPNALRALNVVEGSLMKHIILTSRMSKKIDQAAGTIQVNLSGAGVNKSGSVVTLVFEAITPAQQIPITVTAIKSSGLGGAVFAPEAPVPYYVTVAQ